MKKTKNNNKEPKIKQIKCSKRLFVFVIFLILGFFIAVSKLIEYQIVDFQKYEKLSKLDNQVIEKIPAARGDILDRNGVCLATNVLNLSLVVSDKSNRK